jgi:hypothetical protein
MVMETLFKVAFGNAVETIFPKNLNIFLLKIKFFFMFLNSFDVLISKIIFKN